MSSRRVDATETSKIAVVDLGTGKFQQEPIYRGNCLVVGREIFRFRQRGAVIVVDDDVV